MSNDNQQLDIQNAISDIAVIKQVLNKSEQENIDSKLVGINLNANLLLQSIALFFVFILCIWESISNGSMTSTLMAGGQYSDMDMRLYGIGFVAAILVGLLIPFFFIIWRASKHNNEALIPYVYRNFKYLKNLSFFSDLLMKFIAISLVILASKPEWIAPLLVVFIGDYLLQQRFFTLSIKVSAVLGIGCIAIAFGLFITHTVNLMVPLLIFAIVASISLSKLVLKYQQQVSEDA